MSPMQFPHESTPDRGGRAAPAVRTADAVQHSASKFYRPEQRWRERYRYKAQISPYAYHYLSRALPNRSQGMPAFYATNVGKSRHV